MASSKSIIVTGASRGIGLAIAKYLLKESHKVFLVARTAASLEGLKEEFPGQVEFFAGDLSDFEVYKVRLGACEMELPAYLSSRERCCFLVNQLLHFFHVPRAIQSSASVSCCL